LDNEGKLKLLEVEHFVFLRETLDIVSKAETEVQRSIENLIEALEPKEIKKISVDIFKLIENYKRLGTYRCFIQDIIFHYGDKEVNECFGKVMRNYWKYRNRVFFMLKKAIE